MAAMNRFKPVMGGSPEKATVCEWPSNLTVDSAMLAVNDFDPDSLATLEENGQGQGWYRKEDTHRETTKLTPLLRSFCV